MCVCVRARTSVRARAPVLMCLVCVSCVCVCVCVSLASLCVSLVFSLCVRVYMQQGKAPATDSSSAAAGGVGGGTRPTGRSGLPPIVVNLNSSSSELKLLRVLQTLVNLSGKDTGEIYIHIIRIMFV